MHVLDLEAMHTLKFLGYANIASEYATNGELHVGMQFNDREDVVRAIKTYSISKLVDYKVHKSEPMTFCCKCKYFGPWCEWLDRVNFKKRLDV